MQEETTRDWEPIQQDLGKSVTERLRTKDGWLIRTTILNAAGEPAAVAMVYVPND